MRELNETEKRKSRAKALSAFGKRAGSWPAQGGSPFITEEEAGLLSNALASFLERDPSQIVHAHKPIDEARVKFLLQD